MSDHHHRTNHPHDDDDDDVDDDDRCKDIYAARGGSLTDKQICAGGQPGKVAHDGHDDCVTRPKF